MRNQPAYPNKIRNRLFAISIAITLSACSGSTKVDSECKCVCPPSPCPPIAAPEQPAAEPLQPANWSDLPGWRQDTIASAWPAFLQSCKALPGRTKSSAWADVCSAASTIPPGASDNETIRQFFEHHFRPWHVVNPDNTDQGLITGYYEPLLSGSRQRSQQYRYAIYAPPDDLLVIDLAGIYPQLKGMRLRGRIEGNRVVPYWSRGELDETKLYDKAIVWVEDPIELFFLQVQGSGRVKLPSGETIRVGYADQNGHPYRSIGRLLVERGELKLEEASMQGIQNWARKHPDKVTSLLNDNPSYVFFKETAAKGQVGPNDGPQGALGVPLTPERSIAVDPRVITLGAPVFLATTEPLSDRPLQRLMMAQDTGGAIKGAVRGDFFWGFGAQAATMAGRMRQQGQLWVLLPKALPEPVKPAVP